MTGNRCPAFRQKGGGQRAPFVSTVSQWSSAQYNPAMKVASFGVAYSDPLRSRNASQIYMSGA